MGKIESVGAWDMDRGIGIFLWLAVSTLAAAAEPTTRWVTELTAGRFEIHCDFELDGNESLTSELTDLSSEVCRLLELPHSDETIHIVLFANAKEYGRYIKNYFPALPDRRALFIQDRGPGMLFAHWHDDVRTDLRHEVVHGLLNARNRPLPLWLDEGLAEYFEVASQQRLAGNPHLPKICAELQAQRLPDLGSLEQLTGIEQLGSDQYRDSWAWVHFLLHRNPHTRRCLIQHLAAQRNQVPCAPLSRVIAQEIPNWSSQFMTHFKSLESRAQQQGLARD